MYTQSGRWITSSMGKGGGRVGGGLVRQSSEESNAQNRHIWNYLNNPQDQDRQQQSNSDNNFGSPAVQGNIMDYYRLSEYPRCATARSPDTKIDLMDDSDATTPPSPTTPPSSSAMSR